MNGVLYHWCRHTLDRKALASLTLPANPFRRAVVTIFGDRYGEFFSSTKPLGHREASTADSAIYNVGIRVNVAFDAAPPLPCEADEQQMQLLQVNCRRELPVHRFD